MPKEPTRRPREKQKPYVRNPKVKVPRDAPATSAATKAKGRKNLTLHDWLIVFAYMDSHPDLAQGQIVQHFADRKEGALVFTQSTLSRKIEKRTELEERAKATPNALSSKRPRIVTRPDVERALVLWFRHMEEQRETVTGPMLREKRKRFEDEFNVPEKERLTGDGWVPSFCKTYKIKEYRRHGEAGSVDAAAVEAEQIRVREILVKFAPRDRFNFDETGLFAFVPPDRGLATKQMSGKKKSKFRITLGFACNADGSEKLPPFYIGKFEKPRCFKKQTPQQRGFYYKSNKKAWMTSELFEEWIKLLDIRMRSANRKICLFIDNFSGHNIAYEPTNIQLEWFEPNLTSHVQPLDAGIIRCFKAHYRRAFCTRALDYDDAGESDIYKINLLEAMLMAREAWGAVSATTIKNCWDHTGIQRSPIKAILLRIPTKSGAPSSIQPSANSTAAWDIIEQFATTEMTLPDAENALRMCLGGAYTEGEWQPALKAVMDAEGDAALALDAIKKLRLTSCSTPESTTQTRTAKPSHANTTQCQKLEADLLDSVAELKRRNRIHGEVPTLEDMLDPMEELEIGDSEYLFEGGDTEIVAKVLHEQAVARGDIIEVASDSENDEENGPGLSNATMMDLCRKLEVCCLDIDAECSLELSRNLCRFRAHLRQAELRNAKQVTLDSLWSRAPSL